MHLTVQAWTYERAGIVTAPCCLQRHGIIRSTRAMKISPLLVIIKLRVDTIVGVESPVVGRKKCSVAVFYKKSLPEIIRKAFKYFESE
ncbi:hypothetical protein OU798_02410 [Prolixibacteraceae bacterium Z1-6]|uniref:Uncharacterized protein n=1 Tax=Draconibacterium aestuarii TaxID=2998507 RepID=A0A9X3J616_9BACT|nr:hypothetical protein [Prolixibacteraceae bacterium Z1-6]